MGGLPLIPPTRWELGQLGDDTGFPPTQIEKVVRLLALVDDIFDDPYLGGLVSLTGGTALNMFVLDAPRLSFDLDLNYIATPDPDVMKAERPRFEAAMRSMFEAHDLELKRAPSGKAHAGGKWDLRYRTAWGHRDSIAVDVNYVRRVPLWSPTRRDSIRLGRWQATGVTAADVHELAAGKLNAFYKRALPRDLFDVGLIPGLPGLDPSKLRTAFVVYGAGARPDWRDVCAATPTVAPADLAAQLRATLPRAEASRTRPINVGAYLAELAEKAIPAQQMVVPFNPAEQAFLDGVLDRAAIRPDLLTDDPVLQRRIAADPWVQWKAHNVREYREAVAVGVYVRPYRLDDHGWEVATTDPDGSPRQLSGPHPTVEDAEQAGGFLARLLNDHPRLHILGSDPQRSAVSDVGSAASPHSGEPPTVGLYSPGQGAPWYVQCRNPDGTVNDSSPPYPTYQAASNVLEQLGWLSVATADRGLEQRVVAEPTSTSCRCSRAGWRCGHIEGPKLEADPPDRGRGLSL